MSNSELEKLLRSDSVPEQASEFWEQLPQRVTTKLHWQQQRREEKFNLPPRSVRGWVLGITSAAVLILLGFVVGNWHESQQTTALLQNEKLLREVFATFPNQVQAIIQDKDGLRLVLAELPNVAQSQPLWIKVCEDGVCRSMVTFSGQEVQIAGRPVEVLADAQGGVMMMGDNFFWSSQQGGTGGQLRINAEQLRFIL